MSNTETGAKDFDSPKDRTFIDNGEIDLNDFIQTEDGRVISSDEAFKTIRQVISDCKIELDDDLHLPKSILMIDDAPVFGLHDFSLIIGKAKSRKSFLMTLLMSAFLCKAIEQIETQAYEGRIRLIWFDTEQSGYYVQLMYKRAVKLAGIDNAPDLEVYSLRPFSYKERREIIHQVLYVDNSGNILFAIIDGIRDLVSDINDQEQATDIATWLMKMTDEKGLHISTVLHQNKGDGNARGHLGTELVNKAQTVISVERDERKKDFSVVKAEFCRDKGFNDFAFSIVDGLPVIENDYSPEADSSFKFSPYDIELSTHVMIAKDVFSKNSSLKYSDLWRHIKNSFAKHYKKIGDNKAKDVLTHWIDQDIIYREGEGRKVIYQFNKV